MTIRNLDTHAVIKWRLTDACNYKCPYCIRKVLAAPHQDDERRCVDALPHVRSIAKKLSDNTGKPVKVDLIGGEVTVFGKLGVMVSGLLEEPCIDKVNITSNFSNDRLFEVANKDLTVTLSYHPTQTSEPLTDWVLRAKSLKGNVRFLKCETVAVYGATHVDEFVRLCKEYGLDYQVEEDLLDKRCVGQGCSSKKPSPRYRVTDDCGVTKEFGTRNEFLKRYGVEGALVDVRGHLCSRDFDYIYIEQDTAMYCFGKRPVSDLIVAPAPHLCHRSVEHQMCTLCGNISIYPMPRSELKF